MLAKAFSFVVLLGLLAGQPLTFVPEEATIAGIHGALASRDVTCVQVVQAYLRRIEAYDDRGPALNALISINPAALETAAELDRVQTSSRAPLRPLHCIPIVLKDNYDTADMPTTGGSVTLAASIPLRDAFVVRKLREAGAIVLGKANLMELARGGTTVSSLGGQTKNPYDLTRTPGGSSGGTGAAIAASFGVAGTGSDTGQSVRSPASAQSLVGLRPTRGLISRTGIIPVSITQDEAGPITRTVEDAARMLDVMAGYDPDDPITAFGASRIPRTYTAFLNRDALKGARIGVLTEYFGRDSVHQEVNAVTEDVVRKMSEAGADDRPHHHSGTRPPDTEHSGCRVRGEDCLQQIPGFTRATRSSQNVGRVHCGRRISQLAQSRPRSRRACERWPQ